MIALALCCNPDVLIADEPTTALDVTVQAQILRLLGDLRREFNMAMLLITHDLALVGEIADHVVVMRHGVVREQGPARALLGDKEGAIADLKKALELEPRSKDTWTYLCHARRLAKF